VSIRRGAARRFGGRAAALAVTAGGLYLVGPSVLKLFDALPDLGDVRPWWFFVVVAAEVASFGALWVLLRIALPGGRWLDIAASQLAGNAASRIIPGGAASGSVMQAGMLVKAGHPPGAVAGVLSATGLLTTGMLFALPVLAVPALIIGKPPAHELELGLIASLVLATVLVALGFALLTWDWFLRAVARLAGQVLHLVRRNIEVATVAEKVIAERDQVATAFHRRWLRALWCAAGNRSLDYAALVAAVYAVGGRASPAWVLIAYVGSLALALIPITPGGLGFVETGLTGLLVLAGINADQAAVATLLYRLVSYWAPIPIGALAWAGWRIHPRHRTRAAPPGSSRDGSET
jgi:uncharacterized protein (TIRG00374 family)